VNAVSALVGGDKIVLPDGQAVSNVGEYLLTGIYQQYPSLAQNRERRQVQAAIAGQVIEALFTVDNAQGLLDALGTQVGERRVMLWVKDPEVQAVIADTELGHSLQPAKPHSVEPVLINIGWSKLDGQIV